MAKDPAFLFYPGDWLGGTMGMSFEEKGAYLELLVMQWNCHRITKDAAKRLVGEELWHRISHKFESDASGFFNPRLEREVIKRRQHSDKQRDNANKRWDKKQYDGIADAMPLEDRNENKNEDVLKKGVQGEGFIFPKNDYEIELTEMDVGRAVQFLCFAKGVKDADADMVLAIWGTFKSKNFTGKKSYTDNRDIIRHFFESLKFQKIDGKPVKKSVGKTIDFDKP